MKNLLLKIISFLSFRNYRYKDIEKLDERKVECAKMPVIDAEFRTVEDNEKLKKSARITSHHTNDVPTECTIETEINSEIPVKKYPNLFFEPEDFKLPTVKGKQFILGNKTPQIEQLKQFICCYFIPENSFFTSNEIMWILDSHYIHNFTKKQIYRAIYRLRTDGYIEALPGDEHKYQHTPKLLEFHKMKNKD